MYRFRALLVRLGSSNGRIRIDTVRPRTQNNNNLGGGLVECEHCFMQARVLCLPPNQTAPIVRLQFLRPGPHIVVCNPLALATPTRQPLWYGPKFIGTNDASTLFACLEDVGSNVKG